MPLTDYLVGVAYFVATVGAVTFATVVIVRRRLHALRGAQRLLALAILFETALIAVHVVPLAIGILTRGTALASALLLAAGSLRIRRAPLAAVVMDGDARAPAGGGLSWPLAALALLLLGAYALGFFFQYSTTAATASDFTFFHMPGVARWIQSGTVWRNNVLIPNFPVGAYPNNGDAVFLAATLPWRNDAFVRLVNFPLLGLAGVATYSLARELGASRSPAVLFAAVLCSTQAVLDTALDRVKPETMMLGAFGAGVMFLVRHARTRRPADLVLGGLGLGLAFGARWDGVESVVAVFVVWALTALLLTRRVRALLRPGVVLAAAIALAGGFWLVRNWVVTGDPFFPIRVQVFGATIFGAPYDPIVSRYGYTVAGYLFNGGVLRHSILPAYRVAFGIPGALVGIGTLLALVLAWRRRADVTRPMVLAVGVAALAAFAVYLVTPGSAQGLRDAPFPGLPKEAARWSAPALLLAAAVSAWAVSRLRRGRLVLELAAVAGVIDGLEQSVPVSFGHRVEGLVVLLVLAGLVALVSARRRLRALIGWPRRALPTMALALLALVGAGYAFQHRFNDRRYVAIDPTSDWVRQHARAGHRVGVAGSFPGTTGAPLYAMFGPRLRNSVTYVGYWDGAFLRQYHLQSAFTRALARGHYDLLLVGRGDPPRPGGPAERWATAAGYAAVASSPQWILFERRLV